MVHLTRRYWFSASHRLHNPSLPEPENNTLYGKCNNPGGHGHNYHLEVTVAGPVDQRTGMVLDLAELDELVKKRILDCFDESNLNDHPEFAVLVPTTENLCLEIFRIVNDGWSSLSSGRQTTLERVRLEETSSNFFEVFGETARSGLAVGK
jgi:6-pyruvoyltetrahydropterin/6-carboxytetrahydropterin synthase